jgi:general secretion pathway protein N
MRRALLIVVVALLLIGGAAIALAPAALVAPMVERATGGRVIAADLEGSIWRGRGVFGTAGARLPLAWTLEALPLLTGNVALHVTPPDTTAAQPRADIAATRHRATLRDVRIELPASAIADIAAPNPQLRAAVVADGTLAVAIPRLDWAPPANSGDARVVWRDARLSVLSGTPVDLGEVTAMVTASGDRLNAAVSNAGGDLDVRGEVGIAANGMPRASLLLTPRRPDNQALARALAAVGTPDGAGWRVTWPGR